MVARFYVPSKLFVVVVVVELGLDGNLARELGSVH